MKNPRKNLNFKDPFSAGQMIGMLLMLTFIEQNNGIPDKILQDLKAIAADSVQEYFDKPTEDIFLMVDTLVKEMI